MKRTHLLSYALLFLLLILGYPKITHTENPDTADLGGDEPSTGISFGITNNGSDWYIDFPYAYSSNYCNCTNLVSQSIDLYVWDQFDNQLLHVVGQGGSGNPDYDLVIGPGKNLNLDYSINFSGSRSWHRNLDDPCSIFATCIGTGVDCGCDYTYTGTISGTATTAAIKNPTGFSAADGADDNSVTLNWSKGTDIPDFTHKYRVYVDGSPNHIVQLNGDVRTWTHTGLQPGETHSYRLTTYYTSAWAGTHESGGVTDSGSTFSTNTQASDGEHANRTLVKWADLSDVADEVRIERSNVGSNDREELEILSGTARSYSDAEGIPGFTYTYYVTPLFEGTPFLTGQDNGYSKPNGSIKGTVKSKFGAGVSGVDIEVELLSSIPAGGASLPGGCVTTYCTTTDITGYYEIKGIYYYTDADFKIVPSKTGAVTHVFTPAESLRSLDENVQALTNIDFVDQTVFTVNGHVNYPASANGQACGVKGVEILVNGDNLGIKTDSDGFWEFVIQDEGDYTFKPKFLHHSILDSNMDTATTVTVTGDVFDIDFTDFETDDLVVIAQGGCQAPLGPFVRVRVTATDPTCFDQSYMTDASGNLLIPNLAAREYKVMVDSIGGMSSNISNIMAQIGNMPIDIDLTVRDTGMTVTEGMTTTITPADTVILPDNTVLITPADTMTEATLDTLTGDIAPLVRFIYRSPLVIAIDWEAAGAEITDCQNSAGDDIMLLESGFSYTIFINVNESLGLQCPIDSGFLKIYDQISDRGDDFVKIPIKNGVAKYQIDAGQPITAHNPSFHDHEKYMYIVPEVDLLEPMPATYWLMVTGTKSNPGSFISRTPEIPMIILHDPPGDNSSSFIEKGTSFKHFTRNEVLVGGDAGFYLDLLLGAKFLTPFSGNGFGTQIKFSASAGQDNFNRNGIETTITFTETFSTSDADNFTGHSGDVYIGAAFNNEFALTEILTFNKDTCGGEVDIVPTISAEDFATTFVYTEKHIKNSLIPTISFLAREIVDGDPASMTQEEIAEVNNLLADSIMWVNILEQNALHRSQPAAKFKENISFSAGAPISKVYTTDTATSVSYEYNRFVNSSFALGAKIDNEAGIWFDSELGVMGNFRFSQSVDIGDDTTNTTSVGYILDDGDIGDFLSVDILTDTAYNVPAFHLKAGTTSCPNEEGTQSRDRVMITIPDNELNNIPIDEPANFIAQLTNLSDSRETREYHVRAVSTTNPDGAAIRLGGQLINNSAASFFLEHGEVFNINLEVRKGPLASNYERIGIMMYPPCEYELWQDNGDLVNVDTAYITVRYESECSSVSLVNPVDGWLVNQNNNDFLHTTFAGYDLDNVNLEQLVLQFKREGQGYTDVVTVKRDSLIGPFYDVFFDVSNYEDGNYRIRAKALCNNGKGYTYSSELKGIIDRTSLAPYGIPTPSDGFLQVGQEISVSYDKDINCALNYPTNISLVRTDNDSAINFTVQCNGNKLILMPDMPLTDVADLDGVEVTATAHLLRDNNGNIQKYPVVWSFLVNVKPIFWDPEDVYASAIVGHPAIVRGTLKNNALLSKAFSLNKSDSPLIDYPEWLTPLQSRGTVLSNGDYMVDFAVDPDLLPGIYQGTVTADVEGMAVSMDVTFELLARPVNWSFDGNQYDNSMTIVAQFSLLPSDAPLTTDTRDVVAAFVNGEIRGIANIEYIPEIDKYAAFLTVFSNDDGGNNAEEINFRFWKALSGVEYSAVEFVDFQPEGRVGTAGSPLILHPEGILQVIPLNLGWNWISLNLHNPDLSREKVFQSIIYPASQNTITIKTQTKTSEYANGSGWNGNLGPLKLGRGYLVHLSDHPDTLRVPGTIPTTPVEIDLDDSWNWIGFPEQVPRPVNEVLDTIIKADGDLVKSQYTFSTYDAAASGWLGNFKEFKPGGGYKIFLDNQTTLVYRDPSEYKVYPGLYEFNMNVTAILDLDELGESNADDLVVGAFIDGYCQGIADIEYVELLHEYRAMLLVLGGPELLDAEIEFRVLNKRSEVEYIGNGELVTFSNDDIMGTILKPYDLFDFDKPLIVHDGTEYELANCIPNPLNDIGVIPFTLAEGGSVNLRLFDVNGQLVKTLLDADLTSGRHQIEVSLGELQSGLYFYVLDTPGFKATKKLVKN